MVRNNVLLDPEQFGVHELINRLLSMVPLRSYKLSPTLNDSEVNRIIRALSSQIIGIVEPKDVTSEISALQVKCHNYVSMQQKRWYPMTTNIMYASMWFCLIIVGLDVLCAELRENHDLKIRHTSVIVSTMIILLLFLVSVAIVRYLQQIVSPYSHDYDLFDLNQSLNEKWKDLVDLKRGCFSSQIKIPTKSNNSDPGNATKNGTLVFRPGNTVSLEKSHQIIVIYNTPETHLNHSQSL